MTLAQLCAMKFRRHYTYARVACEGRPRGVPMPGTLLRGCADMRSLAAAFVWVVLLTGCADGPISIPTAPSPSPSTSTPATPAPIPAGLHGEEWKLVTTLTATTGPACWPTSIGRSIVWRLLVDRSTKEVRLLYDIHNYPTDHIDYVGALNGREFAISTGWAGSMPCASSKVERFAGSVTGRFSEDGRAITASEIWSYILTSGETFNMYFDWDAARQFEPGAMSFTPAAVN
jgi:hypothetical protein